MHKLTRIFSILPCLLLVNILATSTAWTKSNTNESSIGDSNAVIFAIDGKFVDVAEELKLAIEMRGLKISSTSHIAQMLERTATAVGAKSVVYDDGIALEFCKAELSHQMLAAEPHNIVFCPYRIVVYALHNSPGKVFLSYRRFPSPSDNVKDGPLKKVEQLLREIIEETGAQQQ